jgi:hypothetical protein
VDMGDEKSNPDNGKRQNKKSSKQDVNNKNMNNNSGNRIIDIINEQFQSLTGGAPIGETLFGTSDASDASTSDTSGTSDTSNSCNIKTLADQVLNINILRVELDKLQLDFKARLYFENDVRPLIDTLTVLSFASNNFSNTARNLSSINFGRTSNIKKSLDLTDSIDDIAEDLVKVLKCKIDNLLKLSKCDCK